MFVYAENFDTSATLEEQIAHADDRIRFRLGTRFFKKRFERSHPETSTYTRGSVLQYLGPTVTVQNDHRLGLEVRSGDLVYAADNGVWIGTAHYAEMPDALRDSVFVTSNTREGYKAMVDERLEKKFEIELMRQNGISPEAMTA